MDGDAPARMAAPSTSISNSTSTSGVAPRYNYDGRAFRSVQNSANGQVDDATIFRYRQEGNVLSATYGGGAIRQGTMIGLVDGEGRLDFRYQHVSAEGEIMTGECRSTPEVLPDGRIRLHEKWRWTCKDFSEGESVVEEIELAARSFRLQEIPGRYAICRLGADAPIPEWADRALSGRGFASISGTPEELSVICREEWVPEDVRHEAGWACLQVQGPFAFDVVGVLATLAGALAEAGVPILAVSTFETDYLLVKEEMLARAVDALRGGGHLVERGVDR